jgi:hypothetical protein
MSTSLRDAQHPIWRIGTILSLAALVLSVNFFNAKQFDWDDYVRIFQTLGGGAAIVGGGSWAKHLLNPTQDRFKDGEV